MRHYYLSLLGILSICMGISCSSNTAESIVLQAIAAHGGSLDAMNAIKEISLEKEIWTFDKNGDTITNRVQILTFQPNDPTGGEIFWYEGQNKHWIEFDTGLLSKKINNVVQLDKELLDKALQSYLSASFTLFQPFYLSNENIQLTYMGIDTLFNGQIVYEILAKFPENDAGHQESWTYFFDLENHLLIGMMVFFNDSFSLILNKTYKDMAGIKWHGKRNSYKIDSNRQVEYLRASYDYRNYTVTR